MVAVRVLRVYGLLAYNRYVVGNEKPVDDRGVIDACLVGDIRASAGGGVQGSGYLKAVGNFRLRQNGIFYPIGCFLLALEILQSLFLAVEMVGDQTVVEITARNHVISFRALFRQNGVEHFELSGANRPAFVVSGHMHIDEHQLFFASVDGQVVDGETAVEIEELVYKVLRDREGTAHGALRFKTRQGEYPRVGLTDGVVEGVEEVCRVEVFRIHGAVLPEFRARTLIHIDLVTSMRLYVHFLEEIEIGVLRLGNGELSAHVFLHVRFVHALGVNTRHLRSVVHFSRIHEKGVLGGICAEAEVIREQTVRFVRAHRFFSGVLDAERLVVVDPVILQCNVRHVNPQNERKQRNDASEHNANDFNDFFCFHITIIHDFSTKINAFGKNRPLFPFERERETA